jgi:hypothetical protein
MFIADKQLIDDAKALGFDGAGAYNLADGSCGYTLEQLRRWLNIKFGMHICVQMHYDRNYFWIVQGIKDNHPTDMIFPPQNYKETDLAICEFEGVKKAIEYLKEGKCQKK